MLEEVRNRVQKAGQPPGTLVYTGDQTTKTPRITVVQYSAHDFHETTGTRFEDCFPPPKEEGITWINVEGLHDVDLINQVSKQYQLHPLTVEDILNVAQRPKIEEFDGYIFITLKMLIWNAKSLSFTIGQLSLVVGKNFILSFQETGPDFFKTIYERLRSGPGQRLREQGSDYLMYRLIDNVVDQYFVVLEGIGDQIETIEEVIIAEPTQKNSSTLYHLKRQMLSLRKAIWPIREALSHLLQEDAGIVSSFTRIYLRDVYDHGMQALDTLETFRDMLSGLLDMYLSSLTNRMNEIMKILTIISTIFIPITFIASVYGMNFHYMPELQMRWGYPIVLGVMAIVVIVMLNYFRRKKWL